MAMTFAVCLPTYNRAAFLPQAIESVLSQTHTGWHLFVIDDGSTDDTGAVVGRYLAARPYGISYIRCPSNRGGVAANAIGMYAAIQGRYEAWTRLGSDDWYLPRKLELDALALEDAGACFGPYRNEPSTYDGELNIPSDARAALLRGEFAASWANIAYRTSVLLQVLERHGNFVDPRLRNMEDYLFNVRAARFTEFVWRGELVDGPDGGRVLVGARSRREVLKAALGLSEMESQVSAAVVHWKPDARYRIGADPVCCSNSPEGRAWGAKDATMTEIVRGEDAGKGFPVTEIPKPAVRFIQ